MKKCPYCAEEIQDEAIVCRYCGKDLLTDKPKNTEPQGKKKKKGFGCARLIVLVAILGLIFWLANNFTGAGSGSRSNNPSSTEASLICHEFVKDRLKAPKTAEFPTTSHDQVKKITLNEFEIKSYVDAENSFGATLRNYYTCRVFYNIVQENWRLVDLQITP